MSDLADVGQVGIVIQAEPVANREQVAVDRDDVGSLYLRKRGKLVLGDTLLVGCVIDL